MVSKVFGVDTNLRISFVRRIAALGISELEEVAQRAFPTENRHSQWKVLKAYIVSANGRETVAVDSGRLTFYFIAQAEHVVGWLSREICMSFLSDLTLDELRYLTAVADSDAVLKVAAEALGVKQPAVSKRMDMWRDYRPPLVEKVGNRDVLTERGREVVATARVICRQMDDLSGFLRKHQELPSTLYLAAGSLTSQWFLAPAIAKLSADSPATSYRTRVLRGARRIRGVADGQLDLAIVSHDETQIQTLVGSAALTVTTLSTQALCVVTRKDSELADRLSRVLRGQLVPLALLSDLPLVGLDANSGVRRLLERQYVGTGKDSRLRFAAETGGWMAAKEFARCGVGVAIVPLAALSRDDENVLVIRRLAADGGLRHCVI